MPSEIPTFIDAPTGRMFALEHHPHGGAPDYWVVSLSSGLLCRTGPRRLYVDFARTLARSGIGVIRVDLPGLGDSDGPGPEMHFDMHRPEHVQVAIDYVKRKYSPKGIVLHGLCSGARVAIKAAAQTADVSAVLAWSVPILTSTPGMPSPEGPKHGVSKAVAEYTRDRVIRVFREAKFLRLRFWKRHFASTDIVPELKRMFWSSWLLMSRDLPTDSKSLFAQSLTSYISSKRPIQFIYGERDICAIQEFKDLNLRMSEDDVLVLPGGTHTFSTPDQRCRAITKARDWIFSRVVGGPPIAG